jgi:thiamine kinase-like enzyme
MSMLALEHIIGAALCTVPGWAGTRISCVRSAVITGGMTNIMYLLEHGEAHPSRVVARVVSAELDGAIDRARELRVVQYLGSSGIGPRLYGTVALQVGGAAQATGELPPEVASAGMMGATAPMSPVSTLVACAHAGSGAGSGGAASTYRVVRFEEFIEGRTLATADLRDAQMGQRMAAKLALLHAQNPNLDVSSRRASAAHSPAGIQPAGAPAAASPPSHAGTGAAKSSLDAQFSNYLALMDGIRARVAAAELAVRPELAALLAAADWRAECAWLGALMAARGGPVVLAHGDAQEGNWILGDNNKLVLIDYEYAAYNWRGFDLGNIFCEHLSDYSRRGAPGFFWDPRAYPSNAWQSAFLGAYACAARQYADGVEADAFDAAGPPTAAATTSPGAAASGPAADDADWLARTSCEGATISRVAALAGSTSGADPGRDGDELLSLPRLLLEARLGALASHLYWSLWSVVMAAGKEPPPSPAPPATGATEEPVGAAGAVAASHCVQPGTGCKDDQGSNVQTVAPGAGLAPLTKAASLSGAATVSPGGAASHAAPAHAFSYLAYGRERHAEYARLKAQLQAECAWARGS